MQIPAIAHQGTARCRRFGDRRGVHLLRRAGASDRRADHALGGQATGIRPQRALQLHEHVHEVRWCGVRAGFVLPLLGGAAVHGVRGAAHGAAHGAAAIGYRRRGYCVAYFLEAANAESWPHLQRLARASMLQPVARNLAVSVATYTDKPGRAGRVVLPAAASGSPRTAQKPRTGSPPVACDTLRGHLQRLQEKAAVPRLGSAGRELRNCPCSFAPLACSRKLFALPRACALSRVSVLQ